MKNRAPPFVLLSLTLAIICVLVLMVLLIMRRKHRQGNEELPRIQRLRPVGRSLSNLVFEEDNGVCFLSRKTFQLNKEGPVILNKVFLPF